MEALPAARALALGATLLSLLGAGTATGVLAHGATASSSAPGSVHRAEHAPDRIRVVPGSAHPSAVLATPTARVTSVRASGRWSGSVDVLDQSAVNAAYWRSYAPGVSTGIGWTGDDSRYIAGSSSAASRTATRNAVNYVRSLGGLAPVAFDSTLNSRSQMTALIMSANKALSHSPSSSWRCYTRTGAANAGRSNLALAYPSITSASVVSMYMSEPGGGNKAVGHRRWLMNPFTTSMGSGSTSTANAMTVIGPTSSTRPNPTWVSWPTAGYFPSTLEPRGRWSLSAGSSAMSFRYASVRVYRNGTLLRTTKYGVENGYAQPTLVWQVPSSVSRSGYFRVVVSGIRRTGTSTRYTRSYWVHMFTPRQ